MTTNVFLASACMYELPFHEWVIWLFDNCAVPEWRWIEDAEGRLFICFEHEIDAVAFKLRFKL